MAGRAARFSGLTAVVTGGSGGLGRAVCAGLTAEEAAVAVVDVDAEAVARDGRGPTRAGGRAEGYLVDVRDRAEVEALMATGRTDLGAPHVLVDLAGGSLGTPARPRRDRGRAPRPRARRQRQGHLLLLPGGGAAHGGGRGRRDRQHLLDRRPAALAGDRRALRGREGRDRRADEAAGARGRAAGRAGQRDRAGLFLTDRLQGMFDAMPDAERQEVLDAIPLHRMPELRRRSTRCSSSRAASRRTSRRRARRQRRPLHGALTSAGGPAQPLCSRSR